FRDHKVSLTKNEVIELIENIKEYSELKGSSLKTPLPIEGDHIVSFRRAVYPAKDMKKGHIVAENDLIVLRPNHGIDARDFYKLIGRKLKNDIVAQQKLDWNLFE